MSWIGSAEQAMVNRSMNVTDTLWVVGDNSPNAGLMLLSRKGFTDFNSPIYSIENLRPTFIIHPNSSGALTFVNDSLYAPLGFSDKATLLKRRY